MPGKTLRIQMLGSFAMYYGDKAVTLKKVGNAKSIRLLQMLLLSAKEGISKSEIMDNLYGWNEKADAANRNKNLNNLVYRLKGQLTAGGLPEEEYVEIRDRRCYFKSSFPLELDIHEFEESVKMAKSAREGAEKTALLWKANELYGGELLPANLSDIWFFQKSKHFKSLYVFTIHELENALYKNRDYKDRILLYKRAASIYPFDNWQVKLMRCNLELYRYDEALNIYHETAELYAREMGMAPTKEMQECFEALELIDENHHRSGSDANSWRDMDKTFMGKKGVIKQALFEEEERKGAYYCTYPSFVDYCRLVVRLKERNPFPAALMFLTISQKKKTRKPMDLQEQMQLLKEALSGSLRMGDAFTRYGNRHFILMLFNTRQEFCSIIFKRVEEAYVKASGKGELWYYADMTRELDTSL